MGNYTTIAEMRTEGLLEADHSDSVVDDAIDFCEQFIERICDQHFYSASQARRYDGRGTTLLILDVPLIGDPTEIAFRDSSNSWVAQAPLSNFSVYNRIPTDRTYPRIKIDRSVLGTTIVDVGLDNNSFPRGTLNIRVTGNFGFVESDGTVPKPIVKAAKMLTAIYVDTVGDGDLFKNLRAQATKSEAGEYDIVENMLNGHWTGVPQVDRILKMYRRKNFAGHV